MRIFEPHAHTASRVTDDYERMALAGIVAVCEPAFWQGQPRTSVGTFVDYFDLLLGFERWRASKYGIRHVCTIALNPKEANDGRVNQAVIEAMPRYLEKDGVVAVGEVGFDDQTATEERFFRVQIELAMQHELPLIVHLPHRDKVKGLERTLAILGEMKVAPERVLIDHNTEETVPLVVETGHYIGFSIYPDTKMTEERVGAIFERYGVARMSINSAADWGRSDPLKVPRTIMHLRARGFPEAAIETLVWTNPVAFFSQTGRLDPAELEQPLTSPDARARLRDTLEPNGLEVVTLNGFPYGDFHAERVKEEVYRPDWTDVRRHHYTLDLARLLCELLPADVEEGTISTLPLTYGPAAKASSAEECPIILAHLAVDLHRLAERHGRQIRVCLEPEPDCIVETSEQAIAFFHDRLRPAVRRRGVDPAVVDRHLGLCFDACHQAVEFADPAAAWRKIAAAGIRVGKDQPSSPPERPE